MTRTAITALCLFFVMLAPLPAESPSEYEMYWPQWRGPSGNGVAASSDPPVEWSESKNVKWKTAIPGKGSSSPIIWGDSIFVTSAVPTGVGEETGVKHQFVVFAIKRQNGEPSWRTTVRTEIPHEGTHRTGTWASNSAVTDGEHVYAYFGSRGLYSLDMSGNVKWERDFGDMHKRNSFGEGSSPALHGNRILVQWDQEGPSFLVALDRATGEEIWRIDRNEPSSWSTPRVVEHDGVEQVLTAASNRVRSYDLKDGSLIWECEGLGANVIPAPVVVDDIAIMMSGHRQPAALAIRLDGATGNITGSKAIAWSQTRDTPYTPSPLLYGESLYFLKRNSAVLSTLNAKTGVALYGTQRLEGIGDVYSSPVGANGRVYITDRDGNTLVIRHGSEFEILASNSLDDGFDASAAIVDDEIFLRGKKHLYCISE
jgi:outer membrane protein assembly factor BamB